ncbi:MAG: cell division protein FtsA [Patescibacteria group bacterium]|nr:cell division protein FtsA [Patescibacteria group bacterium]
MYITSLDIGTSQIKALIAETEKNGKLSLIAAIKSPSSGIRKGEINDINEAANFLKIVFEKLSSLNKSTLKNIFINIGGANVKSHSSRGIVAVSRADNEISQDDIDRVIKASQAIKLSPNRMIIHTVTKEFIIDGVGDAREPLGMFGTRLEVNSAVIDAPSQNYRNICKLMDGFNAKISGVIYNPLAASRSALTKIKKDLGTVLIDIGAGSTTIGVYEEGKLLHTSGFPVGGGHITNDLAIGLKCSVSLAEAIKIFFGSAVAKEISGKEKISVEDIEEKIGMEISELDKNFKNTISRRDVAEIIESRLAEIFEFVNNELKLIGKNGRLPAGAVICGGGAEIPAIVDFAKDELKLPAEIGFPEANEIEIMNPEISNEINHPEFAVSLGLLLTAKDQWLKSNEWPISDKFSFVKKILNYFIP